MNTQRVVEDQPEVLRLLLVDPDLTTRKTVQAALEKRRDYHLVGECGTAMEAVPILREAGTDVLLCETELPGIPGFSLLEMLPQSSTLLTIFMNRSDRYAAGAFEASAVDYILKPLSTERLDKALDRALRRAHAAASRVNTGSFRPAPPGRLAIRTGKSVLFLNTAELDWAEAEGKHVRLHIGKEAVLLKMSISTLESELDPACFVRIHRSTLVNLERVRWVQPWMNGRSYQVVLHDGTRLVLSRKDHLRKLTQRAIFSV